MKMMMLRFSDALLSREQMRAVKGGGTGNEEGDSGPGCPPAGTRVFFTDSYACGVFEYGFNAEGASTCNGTIVTAVQQPCGIA
jgi:hypothetical protein